MIDFTSTPGSSSPVTTEPLPGRPGHRGRELAEVAVTGDVIANVVDLQTTQGATESLSSSQSHQRLDR
jgi:hypothetical protein